MQLDLNFAEGFIRTEDSLKSSCTQDLTLENYDLDDRKPTQTFY